jgi:hypothetical protein
VDGNDRRREGLGVASSQLDSQQVLANGEWSTPVRELGKNPDLEGERWPTSGPHRVSGPMGSSVGRAPVAD